MARRPGFTIVELLVSMAILAVVMALLVPAISSLRTIALRIVCAGRLKDLTSACNLYRMETETYPIQPGTTLATQANYTMGPSKVTVPAPKPTDMDPAFLNALSNYLPFPKLDVDVSPEDLPHVVQSPMVEDVEDDARKNSVEFIFSKPALYTGYAYCVRPKDATLVPDVKLIRKDRIATPRGAERAVIWADDLHWSYTDYAWSFAHYDPRAKQGQRELTYFDSKGLLGQHRAFSDGSVEWVNGADIDLKFGGKNQKVEDKASLSVSGLYFFWF